MRYLSQRLSIVLASCIVCACSSLGDRNNHDRSPEKTIDTAANPRQTTQQPSPSTSHSSDTLYICEDITQYINRHVGSGECVDLLKACAKTPHTQQWRPGDKVWGNNIPIGTAIATFKHARYPNKHGYHAAIYVSQDDKGIYVWDQWREKAVHLRLIKFDQRRKKPGNDATRYRIITQ